MAKQEQSAGVVLFRRGEDNLAHYLLLDYGRHWDFPKGHVEKGEDLLQTALRELEEETGITGPTILPGFAHQIEYFFRDRRKALIHKAVWFCLGETDATTVRLSHEHVAYEFLAFDAALQRLSYPSAKSILREAHAFLSKPPEKAIS